jgi:hypothetical protein
MRWPTYFRLQEQAKEGVKVIFDQDDQLAQLIRRTDTPSIKGLRGRARKAPTL